VGSSSSGTDRGGDCKTGLIPGALSVCNDLFFASCWCAILLCVGARVGTGGSGSCDRAWAWRSIEDFAFRGGDEELEEKYPLGESPSLGEDGAEPTDELSVIESPLDLEGTDDVSESLSEALEE